MTNLKISNAAALPMEAMAVRLNPTASSTAPAAVISSPTGTRFAEPAPHQRRELPARGELFAQAGGRVEPAVGGAGGGEQSRDAHQPVAGLAEAGLGRHRERGSARGNDLRPPSACRTRPARPRCR